MRQRGLAHARNVLDQQVAAGQQAGHAVLHLGIFAHDHRVKLVQKRFDLVLCIHSHSATLSEKDN
ncbi:hypothetical protein D3C71_1856640 [compost metagenome]